MQNLADQLAEAGYVAPDLLSGGVGRRVAAAPISRSFGSTLNGPMRLSLRATCAGIAVLSIRRYPALRYSGRPRRAILPFPPPVPASIGQSRCSDHPGGLTPPGGTPRIQLSR